VYKGTLNENLGMLQWLMSKCMSIFWRMVEVVSTFWKTAISFSWKLDKMIVAIGECRATLNNIPFAFGQEGNHPSDYLGLRAAAFINNVKKRCCEGVSPVSAIYAEELGNIWSRDAIGEVDNLISRIPTYYSCKTAVLKLFQSYQQCELTLISKANGQRL